jgi:hypothetical protein
VLVLVRGCRYCDQVRQLPDGWRSGLQLFLASEKVHSKFFGLTILVVSRLLHRWLYGGCIMRHGATLSARLSNKRHWASA